MTSRPHDGQTISSDVDDWIRQFITRLETRLVQGVQNVGDAQLATIREIVATLLDSGVEFEAILAELGRVGRGPWSDDLNRRRFLLIDKEIEGTLTSAETIELAALTQLMREQVDSETNLPLNQVRALQRKRDGAGGLD